MIKGKKVLAIIPARGGSNGIPNKNIVLLKGKPLIAWSIEAALSSKYVDRVIVSTDNEEIAEVSLLYKAEIPFLRPKELARDDSFVIDTVFHAITSCENGNQLYDIILLLQPTSPLRVTKDIDEAIEYLFFKQANSIISVCHTDHLPILLNTLGENLEMDNFFKNNCSNINRQSLPKYYRINGAIYVAYKQFLSRNKSFLGERAFAFIMPKERSIDIDEELDLKLCEFLLQNS